MCRIDQVREIAQEPYIRGRAEEPFRWTAEALLALQEASEAYLVKLFEDAYVTDGATPLAQPARLARSPSPFAPLFFQQPLRHSRQESDHHAQGHPINTAYSRSYRRSSAVLVCVECLCPQDCFLARGAFVATREQFVY